MGLTIISTLIVIAVLSPSTNLYFSTSGTWSSPHVTGDVPLPGLSGTFTKVSYHQVVLHKGWVNNNKYTYVLDMSRMVSL